MHRKQKKINTLYHFYLMTVTSNLYPQVLNYALYIVGSVMVSSITLPGNHLATG